MQVRLESSCAWSSRGYITLHSQRWRMRPGCPQVEKEGEVDALTEVRMVEVRRELCSRLLSHPGDCS